MVKAGYKQTDVGEIPDNWETKEIRQVCKLVNGRGFKPHEWQKNGLPIIRIQNLNGSDEFNYYEGNYDKKLEVKNGQLLFAWSGSRGTSFGPHVWKGSLGLLNYHTWKIAIDQEAVSSEYFLYALRNLTTYIEKKAHGASALVHTQKWEMEGYEFPLPKNRNEQKAIADALSDVDALIGSLEKLIAKKRDIKTGTMQQLLTGKKRLPGFGEGKGTKQTELGEIPEDWDVMKFSEHFAIYAGGDVPKNSLSPFKTDRYRHPIYANAIQRRGLYGYTELFRSNGNSITVTARGNLGHAEYREEPFFPIVRLLVLEPKGDLDSRFSTYAINERVEVAIESTGVPQLTAPQIGQYSICAPIEVQEQKQIGALLFDIESDISALEKRLTKTKAIKQGMMQELLTGKTRLV